jgi:predicted Holliday junction resolvase-like endonuclease
MEQLIIIFTLVLLILVFTIIFLILHIQKLKEKCYLENNQ